jgi:hypothetical protein
MGSTRQPAVEQETTVAAEKSDGDGNGDGECHTPPSWDLVATALVLAAEATAALIADDTDGGNSGVAIVSSASH